MTTRYHKLVEGEHYHIYNRGNGKMTIFHDDEDREKFLRLLRYLNVEKRIRVRKKATKKPQSPLGQKLVFVGAYVLMPNHFHILLKQNLEGGISKFILKVMTGYVMYYNKKYIRTGSLFEGPFKSKLVTDDAYLKYLFSYIHLNPLKIIDKNWKSKKTLDNDQKNLNYLGKYFYSSYLDYLKPGNREEGIILSKREFPDYFENSIKEEIFSWIKLE